VTGTGGRAAHGSGSGAGSGSAADAVAVPGPATDRIASVLDAIALAPAACVPFGVASGEVMPFGYYDRLSARKKAIYRRSDAVTALPRIGGEDALAGAVEALRQALDGGSPKRAQAAASRLCKVVTDGLGCDPVGVAVRTRRPRKGESELHGLYEWVPGEPGVITIWMRTASRREVVAFRTFLRTLAHELCHHVDVALLRLPESFHTEGFFKRESDLVRQILAREAAPREPKPRKKAKAAPGPAAEAAPAPEPQPDPAPEQLELPLG
jgi:hypothetical protein